MREGAVRGVDRAVGEGVERGVDSGGEREGGRGVDLARVGSTAATSRRRAEVGWAEAVKAAKAEKAAAAAVVG